MKNIIVVGGGASGLMAAISAAKSGASVCILEHNDKLGKKILATGNGRCNFSNRLQEPSCYRSSQRNFPWQVIEQFPAEKTIAFLKNSASVPETGADTFIRGLIRQPLFWKYFRWR